VSIKAVAIAIKLTIEGINQLAYFQIWLFVIVSTTCIIILLVYLNKLGYCIKPFNTDVVYPIYYLRPINLRICDCSLTPRSIENLYS
jgi:hypothetical protein